MRGSFSKHPGRQGQHGSVLVLFVVSLLVILGVLGLVIDTGMTYFAKSRLSLAADSAVPAAADVYQHTTDPDMREPNAREAADAYFQAKTRRVARSMATNR